MKIVIINFDELNHRFSDDQYKVIRDHIGFKELFPLFIKNNYDNSHKIAVWECIEADFDIDTFNYELFDLMLDLFHETLVMYIENILGVSIDVFDYEVEKVFNNDIYLKLWDNPCKRRMYIPSI